MNTKIAFTVGLMALASAALASEVPAQNGNGDGDHLCRMCFQATYEHPPDSGIMWTIHIWQTHPVCDSIMAGGGGGTLMGFGGNGNGNGNGEQGGCMICAADPIAYCDDSSIQHAGPCVGEACEPEGEPNAWAMLQAGNVQWLAEQLAARPSVYRFDSVRSAFQVLGCAGDIVLHVTVADEIARALKRVST